MHKNNEITSTSAEFDKFYFYVTKHNVPMNNKSLKQLFYILGGGGDDREPIITLVSNVL